MQGYSYKNTHNTRTFSSSEDIKNQLIRTYMYKSDYGLICSLANMPVLGIILLFLGIGSAFTMYAMSRQTTVLVHFFGILCLVVGIWIALLKVILWLIANWK